MTNEGAGSGWFRASINRASELCSNLKLRVWHNPLPRYPPDMAANARKLTFQKEWDLYQSSSLFDIRLVDGALFQFKEQPKDRSIFSYTFLECPYAARSYSEFVSDTFGVEDPSFQFWEDYSNYVVQCELRESVTPVRYDFSPNLYREGIHPTSHIHMGHRSEVRLACQRVMQPLSFFLFIVRQYYPAIWEEALHTHKEAESLAKLVRADLDEVKVTGFKGKDFWELYLA